MKLKDKLIRKLLDAGKKHRILIYPTLALIAVISAISHMVYWGRGNGKKVVASIMVMVMLITQSLFLTSSAGVSDDTPTAPGVATDTDAPSDINDPVANRTINYHRVDSDNEIHTVHTGLSVQPVYGTDGAVVNYKIILPSDEVLAGWCFGTEHTYQKDHVTFSDMYLDPNCTIPVGDSGVITADWDSYIENNCYNVYFSATRNTYPVTIIDNDGGNPAVITAIAANETTGDIYPSASYTVLTAADYNMYRIGFTYFGLEYGGEAFIAGQDINIDPSDEMPISALSLAVKWTAMKFPVTFDAIGDNTPSSVVLDNGASEEITREYTYGSTQMLPTPNEIWASSDAYILSGWSYGDEVFSVSENVNTSQLVERTTDDLTENPNIVAKKLTAIWSYKNIKLTATNDGVVDPETNAITITGTYGDSVSSKFGALYLDGTQSEFTFSLSTEDVTKLGQYGLGILGGEGYFTIKGQLSDITPEGGISVKLLVKDSKIDDNPDTAIDESVSEYPITIVSNRRTVYLDKSTVKGANESATPTMVFDGSAVIPVHPRVEVTGLAELDGVKDNIYATVSSTADLDNANAGKNKDITLIDVALAGDPDAIDKYILGDITETSSKVLVEDVATVYQMALNLGIKLADGEESTVLFGEATPEYTLYLIDPTQLEDTSDEVRYNNLSTDSDKMNFIKNILGFTEFNVTRTLYSSVGTYTVVPQFNSEGKNYVAITEGLSANFNVVRDDGVKYTDETADSANFKLSSEKGTNGYYQGLTITACGGEYNKIRLIGADEGDIPVDMTKAQAEALFSSAITLPDMLDGTVSFQMLNTNTGAITNIVTMTNVNIDTSAPVMNKYTVSPNVKYFNEFAFGSYFHSQMVDGKKLESVTIDFEYFTEGSDCEYLYYSFVDENGEVIGNNSNEVRLVKNPSTGYFEASITVGTGVYGQLIVYASDTTGNTSVKNKVKLDFAEMEDFIKENQNSSNYYEWMVENTIESSVIQASANGEVASADVWYNNLTVQVDASDVDSGINGIEWSIIGPEETITYSENAGDTFASIKNITSYGKILEYVFVKVFDSENIPVGEYYIEATLKDNAGNTVTLDKIGPYLIDAKAPVITDNTDVPDGQFASVVNLNIKVEEGASESGIASVVLYVKDGNELVAVETWGNEGKYTKEILHNGTYVVVATDNAGNSSTYETTFTNLSSVPPSDPVISVDGTFGNGNWYISREPEVTIIYDEVTSDGVPVETYYKLTASDKEIEKLVTQGNSVFEVDEEGLVNITAWSVSSSGSSSNIISKDIQVDLEAPDIQITDSVVNDDGTLTVNFRVFDDVSGVNVNRVLVNNMAVSVTAEDNAATGSFVVSNAAAYTIAAEDIAGNKSETIEFKPLDLMVSPVRDITSSGAILEAFAYEGTYDISDAYIAIKKDGETSYSTALYNKTEEDYGMSLYSQFKNLDSNSVYWYKVYVKTKTSGEVKVYEGSFKTKDDMATGAILGSVSYGEGVDPVYPIYVSLYQANTIVDTDVIEGPEDSEYNFTKISDGAYNIQATNGYLTKTSAVTVTNGGISYPTDYAENGGINFILSGMSTSVVIEDNSINITADGLEKIYDTTWFEGIITTADKNALENGGTIHVSLHARYMNVTEVDAQTQHVFNSKLGEDAIIERYIQLYVLKEVKDKDGRYINGTPTVVPELYDPITISFPLGELSGERIYVAAVHEAGSNYSFINWDDVNEVSLSDNYVTISTSYFSVYALYRTLEVPKEYTVKWIDGNGNVMKTETVLEGESATPPLETPTKLPSEKYTYSFSGWDTDYSVITKDTIIAAWFTATEIEKPKDEPTTDDPTTEEPKDDPTTEEPKDEPTTEKPNKGDGDYTYMGSAGSPNTGDETPILLFVIMLVVSVAGMTILKKNKE